MRLKDKSGQQILGMSFGVIFSIFLIIIFIIVAFFVINHFLGISKMTKIGLFYTDFQDAVDDAWNGQSSDFSFKIDLPDGIEKVCFANLSAKITANRGEYQEVRDFELYEANVFLVPPQNAENLKWKMIRHLNISKITDDENPYCVPVSEKIKIKKDFYDRLVWVE